MHLPVASPVVRYCCRIGYGVLLFSGIACTAQQATLNGKVTSSEGVPVSSAVVTLHCAGGAHNDAHTTSAQDGSYELRSLEPCTYSLSVSADGFAVPLSATVAITGSQHLQRDVSLSRAAPANRAERPSFQAAGIHGLIDPGGYSASATAGAASSVLHDISGVQRGNAASDSVSRWEDCAALQRLLRAAQERPQDWQASAEAGHLLLQHGDSSAALQHLTRADALAPAAAIGVHLDRVEALILSGSFREASTRLATLSPEQAGPRYYSLRAQAEEGLGEFDAAVRDRSRLLQEAQTERNSFALAYEQLLAGHVNQSDQILHDGLARYPQSLELLVGLGAVQFFQHNFAAALEALLQAAKLDPRDRRPYALLADISRIPDVSTAGVQQAMERHLAVDPDDPGGNAALGSFLLRHSEPEPRTPSGVSSSTASATTWVAEQFLQRALALSPGLTQARSDLALLYHRQHKFDLEARELARVAAEDGSRDVHYRLGLAYRDSGQPELARRAFQDARDEHDSSEVSAAHVASLLSVAPAATPATPPCSATVP